MTHTRQLTPNPVHSVPPPHSSHSSAFLGSLSYMATLRMPSMNQAFPHIFTGPPTPLVQAPPNPPQQAPAATARQKSAEEPWLTRRVVAQSPPSHPAAPVPAGTVLAAPVLSATPAALPPPAAAPSTSAALRHGPPSSSPSAATSLSVRRASQHVPAASTGLVSVRSAGGSSNSMSMDQFGPASLQRPPRNIGESVHSETTPPLDSGSGSSAVVAAGIAGGDAAEASMICDSLPLALAPGVSPSRAAPHVPAASDVDLEMSSGIVSTGAAAMGYIDESMHERSSGPGDGNAATPSQSAPYMRPEPSPPPPEETGAPAVPPPATAPRIADVSPPQPRDATHGVPPDSAAPAPPSATPPAASQPLALGDIRGTQPPSQAEPDAAPPAASQPLALGDIRGTRLAAPAPVDLDAAPPAASQPLALGDILGTRPPAPAPIDPSAPLPADSQPLALGDIRGTRTPPATAAGSAPAASRPLSLGQIRTMHDTGDTNSAARSAEHGGPAAAVPGHGSAAWVSPEPGASPEPSAPLTLGQIRADETLDDGLQSSVIGAAPAGGGGGAASDSNPDINLEDMLGQTRFPRRRVSGMSSATDLESREPSMPVTQPLFCVAPNGGYAGPPSGADVINGIDGSAEYHAYRQPEKEGEPPAFLEGARSQSPPLSEISAAADREQLPSGGSGAVASPPAVPEVAAAEMAAMLPPNPQPLPAISQPLRLSQIKGTSLPHAVQPAPAAEAAMAAALPPASSRPLKLSQVKSSASSGNMAPGSIGSSASGASAHAAAAASAAAAAAAAATPAASPFDPAPSQPPAQPPPASSRPLKLSQIKSSASSGNMAPGSIGSSASGASAHAAPDTAPTVRAPPGHQSQPPPASSQPLKLGQIKTADFSPDAATQGTAYGPSPLGQHGPPVAAADVASFSVSHRRPSAPQSPPGNSQPAGLGEIKSQPLADGGATPPHASMAVSSRMASAAAGTGDAAAAPHAANLPPADSRPLQLGQIVTHGEGAAPMRGYTGVIAIHALDFTRGGTGAPAATQAPAGPPAPSQPQQPGQIADVGSEGVLDEPAVMIPRSASPAPPAVYYPERGRPGSSAATQPEPMHGADHGSGSERSNTYTAGTQPPPGHQWLYMGHDDPTSRGGRPGARGVHS